jgi:Skp family chaperone for outer membrane proteins
MNTRLLAASVIVFPALAAVLSLQGVTRGPDTSGIAIVSGRRVMASSAEARAALTRAQEKQRQTAADLRAKQEALAATRRDLDAATDPKTRAELQTRAEQQQAELSRETAEAQTDIAAAQRELQTELATILNPVLTDLGKERGIELILNADVAVLWGARSLDLTNDVIERMKARGAGD